VRGSNPLPTLASFVALVCCALGASAGLAMPSGGASPSMPSMGSGNFQVTQTPEQRAAEAFKDGLRDMKRADEYDSAAAKETDPKHRDKALRKARSRYEDARSEFGAACRNVPTMPEAWNNLGYTLRKLGSYDDALAAYERALKLRPGYPEALEYRGEAYLGLNRLNDAKQVYLDLFASNRAVSNVFMTAIHNWIEEHRNAASVDAAVFAEFVKWADERAQIAAQTAALTREGTAASWR